MRNTDSIFKEIKGNIWNVCFDYDVLCVTTNGVIRSDGEAVMGCGIALQVKQKCPTIPQVLANMINKNGNVVNRICTITNKIKETELYSFPTKHHWRNKSDIELISRSAHQLVELADKHNWQKILLPRPGCANGGLNWLDVRPILEKIFDNRFYIITLKELNQEKQKGVHNMFVWKRYGGYEVSSKGDKRFSAFYARLSDGRTIEEAYQLDVKGYRKYGNSPMLGKGKPPIDKNKNMYSEYLLLWKKWAEENPNLIEELRKLATTHNNCISDRFANTPVNQARALSEILNSK